MSLRLHFIRSFPYYKLKAYRGTIQKFKKGVIFMDVVSRILRCRLLEKLDEKPEYCKKLGIRGRLETCGEARRDMQFPKKPTVPEPEPPCRQNPEEIQ